MSREILVCAIRFCEGMIDELTIDKPRHRF